MGNMVEISGFRKYIKTTNTEMLQMKFVPEFKINEGIRK